MIIFKLYHLDLKQQFRTRIFPASRPFWRRLIDIGIGVAFGYAFIYIGNYLTWIIYRIVVAIFGPEFYQTGSGGSVNVTPPSLSLFELILSCIIMFVLVGFSEEFCFRGVILKQIQKKHKFWAVVGSSAVFMIYHVFPGIVPIQTLATFWLYYFTFGVMLALITIIQKGDLLTAIIAHGTFNSILFIWQYT
jgi:membrane protease YdiL (CAAX protease family)